MARRFTTARARAWERAEAGKTMRFIPRHGLMEPVLKDVRSLMRIDQFLACLDILLHYWLQTGGRKTGEDMRKRNTLSGE